MSTTRRRFIKTAAASATLLGIRTSGSAQSTRQRTLRAVMQGDLRSFDPIWTSASITTYHGALIYDTLFGVNEDMKPQPQMVSKYGVSEDKLVWTFELRDGLKFSDGSSVTSDDCVASMRRWAVRDGAGQRLFARVRDTGIKDEKTFTVVLRDPYPLILDAFGKAGGPLLYIMRKKEAETDPMQQITEYIGSGPFIFNMRQTRQGASYVYDRNPAYVPRPEPPSAMSGGKVAKPDGGLWDNVADDQTAIAALENGEIDFFELPPIDLVDQLEADKNIRLEILNSTGQTIWARVNFLHPPFNHAKARQALLYLVNQQDVLRAAIGNEKYYRTCGSYFGCGVPMQNDENMQWFKEAPNRAKARQLFQESGYDGRPVIILQPTNFAVFNTAMQLLAQWLREIGVNAQLATSDWGSVVSRRAVRDPPEKGGWSVFPAAILSESASNLIGFIGHSAAGDSAWFGWPANELHEQLRDKWTRTNPEDHLAIAREIQKNIWDF